MFAELQSTLIGIVAFLVIMYIFYRYASGQANVSDEKRDSYDTWVEKHGNKAQLAIFIISGIYIVLMAYQLTVLLG